MSKLSILNLDQNNIATIELICKLQAPFIDCISFRSNNITCIKSMRKGYFPLLTRIYISKWSIKIDLADNDYYS